MRIQVLDRVMERHPELSEKDVVTAFRSVMVDAERESGAWMAIGLDGRVHYGLHLTEPDEQMVSVSVRMPKSTLDGLTAMARRYHISRSEYMRRKLAGAI